MRTQRQYEQDCAERDEQKATYNLVTSILIVCSVIFLSIMFMVAMGLAYFSPI